MNEKDILDTIRPMSFFEGLAGDVLTKLATVAKLVDYPSGSVIFREGDREKRIFIILKGRLMLNLKVPHGADVSIQRLGSGELLGWSPLFNQSPMTATATALEDSQLMAFDAERILDMARSDARFGVAILQKTGQAIANRLRATRQHMIKAHLQNVPVLPADFYEGAD